MNVSVVFSLVYGTQGYKGLHSITDIKTFSLYLLAEKIFVSFCRLDY